MVFIYLFMQKSAVFTFLNATQIQCKPQSRYLIQNAIQGSIVIETQLKFNSTQTRTGRNSEDEKTPKLIYEEKYNNK